MVRSVAEWVEIAYAEALRRLAEQRAARDSARARGVGTGAAAGAATTFISPFALKAHKGWPWMAWVAVIAFIACGVLGLLVGYPKHFEDNINAHDLLGETWTEGDQGEESKRLPNLIYYLSKSGDDNMKPLAAMHRMLKGAYCAFILSIAFWVFTLLTGKR